MSHARILPADTIIEYGPDGVLYARSPHPLGTYPDKITERLEHWAARTPERPFLVRRDTSGRWCSITYAQTLRRVRAVAESLLRRNLSADRPVVILSGNSIEHAVVGLAAMYAGIPYAPVAPAYSLLAREYSTLRAIWRAMQPGLVFVDDAERYARALTHVSNSEVEIVSCTAHRPLRTTLLAELEQEAATGAAEAAHARVGPDTIAKILYTSGSTGSPKGVINTQRMLCANQEMLRSVLWLLAEEPPVLCDWLPWNHTFGGNHNFGIVLYNGGTLYIDDGRPTPEGFGATVANLREIATTAYFNVPRGYDLLVPALHADPGLRGRFFSRLRMLFCAAAALRQQVADDLDAAAKDARGGRIPLVTGLGATESAPFALCTGDADFTGGRIGVPVPGVELKVAPVGTKFEGRLRGPSITPGYWRDEERTRAAFDDEGFYKLGDALGFVDAADPAKGFTFEGRLSEDFKLSTGTWVRVGALRTAVLRESGDLVQDVVIAGHDRDFIAALIFPSPSARGTMSGEQLRGRLAGTLRALARAGGSSSTTIRRAIVLDEPPAIDAQELTDKGSVNQHAVLANRAPIVERLYAAACDDAIIEVQ
jgi:feruloyl-CoA synthase